MLGRHFGPRADLPSPHQSRLVALAEPFVAQGSRVAGPVLFVAALIGLTALIW